MFAEETRLICSGSWLRSRRKAAAGSQQCRGSFAAMIINQINKQSFAYHYNSVAVCVSVCVCANKSSASKLNRIESHRFELFDRKNVGERCV